MKKPTVKKSEAAMFVLALAALILEASQYILSFAYNRDPQAKIFGTFTVLAMMVFLAYFSKKISRRV